MYLVAVIELSVLAYLINRPSAPNKPTLIQTKLTTHTRLMLLACFLSSQLAVMAYLAIHF